MAITEDAPAPARERWTAQWKELYEEVIDAGAKILAGQVRGRIVVKIL